MPLWHVGKLPRLEVLGTHVSSRGRRGNEGGYGGGGVGGGVGDVLVGRW